MFREIITSDRAVIAEGTCREGDALRLLSTGVRRGYRVSATRQGGASITREIPAAGYVPRIRTVVLEPVVPCGTLTALMRRDLAAIDRASGRSLKPYLSVSAGTIGAGFYGIPPAAAKRLIDRALVVVTGTDSDRRPVAVSLVARLAMLAADHQTRTSEPRGYYRDQDHIGPWRKGGCMHDRSSAASCTCREFSMWAEDRDGARQKAREHREHVAAGFIASLTAVTAST